MTTPKQPNKRQLKIELSKDLIASYSNMVMISHTANEMIFDFMQIIPQDQRARVTDRVIMTPTHAKMLLNALQDNLRKYEARFGEVTVPQQPPTLADQLFQTVAGGDDDDSGGDDNNG